MLFVDCAKKIKNALFMIEIGGNDINYALLQQYSLEDITANLVPKIINKIISAATVCFCSQRSFSSSKFNFSGITLN